MTGWVAVPQALLSECQTTATLTDDTHIHTHKALVRGHSYSPHHKTPDAPRCPHILQIATDFLLQVILEKQGEVRRVMSDMEGESRGLSTLSSNPPHPQ